MTASQRLVCLLLPLLLLLGASSACAQLQADWQLPDGTERFRLDNGLEVIVQADSTIPLVTIGLAVQDTQGNSALLLLNEALMFTPHPAVAALSPVGSLRENASWFESGVEQQLGWVTFTLPAHLAGPALQQLYEAVSQSEIDSLALVAAKRQCLDALQQQRLNPVKYLIDEVSRRWRGNAYGPAELAQAVRNASRLSVAWGRSASYKPRNALLYLAGDLRKLNLWAALDTTWAQWEVPPVQGYTPPVPHRADSAFALVHEKADAPVLCTGWQLQGGQGTGLLRKALAAELLARILEQPRDRFARMFVQYGLGAKVIARYLPGRSRSAFFLCLITQNDAMAAVLDILPQEVLNALSSDYISQQMLAYARRSVLADWTFRQYPLERRAPEIFRLWAAYGSDALANWQRELNRVQLDDIRVLIIEQMLPAMATQGLLLKSQTLYDSQIDGFIEQLNYRRQHP